MKEYYRKYPYIQKDSSARSITCHMEPKEMAAMNKANSGIYRKDIPDDMEILVRNSTALLSGRSVCGFLFMDKCMAKGSGYNKTWYLVACLLNKHLMKLLSMRRKNDPVNMPKVFATGTYGYSMDNDLPFDRISSIMNILGYDSFQRCMSSKSGYNLFLFKKKNILAGKIIYKTVIMDRYDDIENIKAHIHKDVKKRQITIDEDENTFIYRDQRFLNIEGTDTNNVAASVSFHRESEVSRDYIAIMYMDGITGVYRIVYQNRDNE